MRLAAKIFAFAVALALVGLIALLVATLFYRHPTEEEILSHMSHSPGDIVIDSTQGDIGWFKVTVKGQEEEFIETFPQWVLPWKEYDWSLYRQQNDPEKPNQRFQPTAHSTRLLW